MCYLGVDEVSIFFYILKKVMTKNIYDFENVRNNKLCKLKHRGDENKLRAIYNNIFL